jgi:hypothetical protein
VTPNVFVRIFTANTCKRSSSKAATHALHLLGRKAIVDDHALEIDVLLQADRGECIGQNVLGIVCPHDDAERDHEATLAGENR